MSTSTPAAAVDATAALSSQLGSLTIEQATPSTSSSSSTAAVVENAVAPSDLSVADRKLITLHIALLLKLLDKLEAECSTPLLSTVLVDSARLSDYSAILSHAITKFVLFVSRGDAAILPSASEELSNHLSGINCLLRSMLSVDEKRGITVGPTRKQQIEEVNKKIVQGARTLIQQLHTHLLSKSTTPLDLSLTAKLHEIVETQLRGVPLTNAAAVGKAIGQQCAVIKDAQEELAEIHIDKGEEEEEKPSNAEDDDDAMYFDAGGDDALTAEEYAIVPSVTLLTNTASALVKSLYLYILKVQLDESQLGTVDFLERVLGQVGTIGARMDDLIGSLYTPQDRSSVMKAVREMSKQLRQNALEIVTHNQQQKCEWPVKSSAAAAAAASSSSSATPAVSSPPLCADCQLVLTTATALQQPLDEQHTNRLTWLESVLTKIHGAHAAAGAV